VATKLAGSSFESSTIGDGKSDSSGGGEGIENDGGSAGSSIGCLFAGVPTAWGSLRVVPREDGGAIVEIVDPELVRGRV